LVDEIGGLAKDALKSASYFSRNRAYEIQRINLDKKAHFKTIMERF